MPMNKSKKLVPIAIGTTRFHLVRFRGEWIVKVTVNGEPNTGRYYYADDKDDALGTLAAMVLEETKAQLKAAGYLKLEA